MQMRDSSLRSFCVALAVLTLLAGAGGMVFSFGYLASAHLGDISAGQSGFIAGAILIGSGLLSLSVLASRGGQASDVHSQSREQPAGDLAGHESSPSAQGITRRW
jgi:hypothetical protein